MQIAAYVRVSTDDQNEQRQMRAIRAKYDQYERHRLEALPFVFLGTLFPDNA